MQTGKSSLPALTLGAVGIVAFLPPSQAHAALNDAKLYHRTDSRASSVKACKDRVSDTVPCPPRLQQWKRRPPNSR